MSRFGLDSRRDTDILRLSPVKGDQVNGRLDQLF